MKIKTISANVRSSKALPDSSWKTIEIGAEAALTEKDNWEEAQATLYQELGRQLRTLWNTKANGNAGTDKRSNINPHYCTEHGVAYELHSKGNQSWYSHKQGNGWCNEK